MRNMRDCNSLGDSQEECGISTNNNNEHLRKNYSDGNPPGWH